MSRRLYETGLSKIVRGMASLCAPTPVSLERLASDIRGFSKTASQLNQANLVVVAREAETAAQSLLVGSHEARLPCARALFRLGELLLVGLLQCAENSKDLPQPHARLERRILVVDDSRVSAVALSNAFIAHDFMVRAVATMGVALAELCAFAPTILVSDVHMPNLDVGVLCRTFRELAKDRPIRVVLVSSTVGDELQSRLDEVKPDAFVSKMAGTATVAARVIEIWDALNV